MAIEHALQRLIGRLREAGADTSAADLVDAGRAARLVGLADRDRLRVALRLVLARSPDERTGFDRAFDLEFGRGPGRTESEARRAGRGAGAPGTSLGGRTSAGGPPSPRRDRPAGSSPVRRGQPPTGRARADRQRPSDIPRERAAQGDHPGTAEPGAEHDAVSRREPRASDDRPDAEGDPAAARLRPTGGQRDTESERNGTRARNTPRDSDTLAMPDSSPTRTRWAAPRDLPHASPDGPLGALDLAADLDPAAEAAAARELFQILFAAPWARRRRPERSPRRGTIDVQRALRRGLASRGVPLVLPRRRPGTRPPRLVFLVDASWSCARASALLLAAVGRLAALARTVEIALFVDVPVPATREIRAWAAGRLAPVSPARRPVPGTFVRAEPDGAGFDAVLARFPELDSRRASDYGRALEVFLRRFRPWLTPARSTVLAIVGDARANQFPACAWLAEELRAHVRRVAWLVTEPAERWGTGDSRLLEYAPHADLVHETATLDGLVASLAAVLRLARRARSGG